MADDDNQQPNTQDDNTQNTASHEQPSLSEGGFTYFSMPDKDVRSDTEEKSEHSK